MSNKQTDKKEVSKLVATPVGGICTVSNLSKRINQYNLSLRNAALKRVDVRDGILSFGESRKEISEGILSFSEECLKSLPQKKSKYTLLDKISLLLVDSVGNESREDCIKKISSVLQNTLLPRKDSKGVKLSLSALFTSLRAIFDMNFAEQQKKVKEANGRKRKLLEIIGEMEPKKLQNLLRKLAEEEKKTGKK